MSGPRRHAATPLPGVVARVLLAGIVLVACQGGDRDVTTRSERRTTTVAPGSSSVAVQNTTPGSDAEASPSTSVVDAQGSSGNPETSPSAPSVSGPRGPGAPAGGAPGSGSSGDQPIASTTIAPRPGDLLLASGFERQVCGDYFAELAPGCEFGIQGDVETGAFSPRTGPRNLRISRQSETHMGVIADLPLPGGHAFIGVAHRVPAIPDGAITAGGYIQLEQMSPTDGSLPGFAMEVRLYTDRRLGLALFRADDVVLTNWVTPVDEWFYLVVEVSNGLLATQRMWVYDAQDRLVDEVSADLPTRQDWSHATRTAQKVGGTRSTLVPMFTYADDWFISTAFRGPTRIGVDGKIVG